MLKKSVITILVVLLILPIVYGVFDLFDYKLVQNKVSIELDKNVLKNNELLTITINPTYKGFYYVVYILDNERKIADSIKLNCDNTCYNKEIINYYIPSNFNGAYTVNVFDYSTLNYETSYFNVVPEPSFNAAAFEAQAVNWYVDNQATGLNNGNSWTNAWQSFSAINWASIQPGDVIHISGGTTSKTYYETLTIGKSGIAGSPITIEVGQDSGHNGIVIIEGDVNGNGLFDMGDLSYGIDLPNRDYITINGEYNSVQHLKIQNIRFFGVRSDIGGRTNIIIKYLYVYKVGNRKDPSFGGDGQCMTSPNKGDGIYIYSCDGCEISNSKLEFINRDGIFMHPITKNSFGINSIHHNIFEHVSDDSITAGDATNVYNNVFRNNYNNYGRFDYNDVNVGDYNGWGRMFLKDVCDEGHPDNIQTSGSYMRIYNNEHENFIQTMQVINAATTEPTEYLYVYNNVYRITRPIGLGDGGPEYQGTVFSLNADRGSSGNVAYDNIKIFSNIAIDAGYRFVYWHMYSDRKITNTEIKDNILLNVPYSISGEPIFIEDGDYNENNVVIDYNLISAGASGNTGILFDGIGYTHSEFASNNLGQKCGATECSTSAPTFINYIPFNKNNNFHYQLGSNGIDDGIDLSLYFNTDKDGVLRPQGLAWDIGAYEYQEKDNLPPFAIDLAYKNIDALDEAGIEISRLYPIHWYFIELYEPGSPKIQPSIIHHPEHEEIVYDANNMKHFFNWTYIDEKVELYHGTQVNKNIVLFFNTHETSPWASEIECVKKRWDEVTKELINEKLNCPLKNGAALNNFTFYVKRLIERYDNDNIDDMTGLEKAVDFWQLGAEYNGFYWGGTNEEYLESWTAFTGALRGASDTAIIVSNGISGIFHEMPNMIYNGVFHAGLTFKYYYENMPWLHDELTPEEQARAEEIVDDPYSYVTIDDVMNKLNIADPEKEAKIRDYLEKLKRSVEFTFMVFDHPELYDIFDVRMYTYYKYQPSRIPEDITLANNNMQQRGYNKPIMPGEGTGAFLGQQGGMPNPARDEFFYLVTSYINKEIIGIIPGPATLEEERAYKNYTAEQARELVKVYTTLFVEGAPSFAWWRYSDVVNPNNDQFNTTYGINGLLYQYEAQRLKKPSFYTYSIMTSKLKNFTVVEKIATEQIKFNFENKEPVYVLWSEEGLTIIDLSSYIPSLNAEVTHIVTELDASNNPIYLPSDIVLTNAIQINKTPVFVEQYGEATTTTTTSSTTTTIFQIELQQGWNLIGIPYAESDPRIEVVFSEILNKLVTIYSYLSPKNWEVYHNSASIPYHLLTVNDRQGYWVKVNESATLINNGIINNTKLNYNVGWNLIAVEKEETLHSHLDADNRIKEAYNYTKNNNSYTYLPKDVILHKGRSYWILVNVTI